MNKKAQANPFDISQRMGYYIIVLMIVSVLFLFFAVLAQGTQTKYYKNTFGTDIITLEEYFFITASVKDPITGQLYNKVLDYDKLLEYNSSEQKRKELNNLFGVYSASQPNALAFEVLSKDSETPLLRFQTINFRSADITKIYPVLIQHNDRQEVGYVNLFFGRVE